MAYQEYPKLMKHPGHSPAVIKPGEGTGLFMTDPVCLQYEKFPHVTVHNLDQEKQYASRGYRPANVGSSEEYDQAVLEAAPVGGYHFQEYPKWKYHPIELPCVVKSAQEESDLGEGWSNHPVQATEDDLVDEDPEPVPNGIVAPPLPDPAPAPAPVKAAPKAKAPTKVAAKVDKRSKAYRAAHAHA